MIALVDCNSFFCSCERLFRPDLWNKPVGVLSNNDGCFVSRTRELKQLGVQMGQPFYQVRELCREKKVYVFSSNFALYTNISERVMCVLKSCAPDIEVYSVDEAFLDLRGIPIDKIIPFAKNLRQKIWREVGIPVSVGVGATKVLAKLANYRAKADEKMQGICVIDGQSDKVLKESGINEVWGVGKRSAMKFQTLGIKTAFDFKIYQNEKFIKKYFTKQGRALQDELRGISCFDFHNSRKIQKQISCSRSFAQSISGPQELKEALARYISRAAAKLRGQKSLCQAFGLYYFTSPFRGGPEHRVNEQIVLGRPTQDTGRLISLAWEVVDRTFKRGFSYHKAGVVLSHLCDEDSEQLDLFSIEEYRERRLLMKAMDAINHREGPWSVKSLGCGLQENRELWQMRQELRSPRYLTGWNELLKVKTI